MPLNIEERHAQAEFEKEQYARLTDDQKKIKLLKRQLKNAQDSVEYYEAEVAELEEQLSLVRNTNDHINNELDKRVKQIDLINGACQQVITDREFGDGLFKDRVLSVLGWPR